MQKLISGFEALKFDHLNKYLIRIIYLFLNPAPALECEIIWPDITIWSTILDKNYNVHFVTFGFLSCYFYIFIDFIHIVAHAHFVLSSLNLKGVCGVLLPGLLWLCSADMLVMVFCRIVVTLYMHWSIQQMQRHTCAGQSCGVLTGLNRHQWATSLKGTLTERWEKERKNVIKDMRADIRHMGERFVSMQPPCCETLNDQLYNSYHYVCTIMSKSISFSVLCLFVLIKHSVDGNIQTSAPLSFWNYFWSITAHLKRMVISTGAFWLYRSFSHEIPVRFQTVRNKKCSVQRELWTEQRRSEQQFISLLYGDRQDYWQHEED